MPHFDEPDAAIAEAFRVLRPQGRFAFSVYADPGQAVGFGLIYSAVAAHGTMDIGLPPGPSFFLFSDRNELETRDLAPEVNGRLVLCSNGGLSQSIGNATWPNRCRSGEDQGKRCKRAFRIQGRYRLRSPNTGLGRICLSPVIKQRMTCSPN